jgi:hypothetical protein
MRHNQKGIIGRLFIYAQGENPILRRKKSENACLSNDSLSTPGKENFPQELGLARSREA